MGVLGSIFGGIYSMTGGAKKPLISQTPPFNAKTKDEENFIQYVDNYRDTQSHACAFTDHVLPEQRLPQAIRIKGERQTLNAFPMMDPCTKKMDNMIGI
jgi:hypothetical protein